MQKEESGLVHNQSGAPSCCGKCIPMQASRLASARGQMALSPEAWGLLPPFLRRTAPCLESLRAPGSRVNGARAGRERDSRAEAEGAAAREGDRHLWRVHPTREAASARCWEPWRAGAAPLRPDQAAPLGWCGPHGPSVPPLPWSCPGVAAVSMVLGVMSPSMPLLPSIPPATPGKGGSETRGFWA